MGSACIVEHITRAATRAPAFADGVGEATTALHDERVGTQIRGARMHPLELPLFQPGAGEQVRFHVDERTFSYRAHLRPAPREDLG
jgi:hypothetical protein